MRLKSDIGRRLWLLLCVLVQATPAFGQTPSVSTTASVPAGTWYFAVRAFNVAGLQSGYSNVVRVTCATTTGCDLTLAWDANTEADLAGYVLVWGASSGVYTNSKTVSVTPGKLPVPPLRLRRAE